MENRQNIYKVGIKNYIFCDVGNVKIRIHLTVCTIVEFIKFILTYIGSLG